MADCARCGLPVAGGNGWRDDEGNSVHVVPQSCVNKLLAKVKLMQAKEAALLAESQRLRDQLAGELALSGAIARLRSEMDRATIDPQTDGRWHVELSRTINGFPVGAFGDTLAAALNAAIDYTEKTA